MSARDRITVTSPLLLNLDEFNEMLEGIEIWDDIPGVRHNYSYFPIFIHKGYGMSRDELYFKMRDKGVLDRRFFLSFNK